MPSRDMSTTPTGCAGVSGASIPARAGPPDAPGAVWVLEDTREGDAAPCLAIAERLGVEFRRVPLRWGRSWLLRGGFGRLSRAGSLTGLRTPLPLAAGAPLLTLSAGRRTAPVAAWLKHACGSRMVHYGAAGAQSASVDLRITDTASDLSPTDAAVLALLGPPHRLSLLGMQTARRAWHDRLSHLPHPRLALIVGTGPFGAELQPSEAFRLAAGLADALHGSHGAILATVDRRTGREATDALATGLGRCLHLLHRETEPGPNPELGFMALADAIVVAGHAGPRLLAACALPVPIYVTPAGPLRPSEHRLHRRLLDAGQIRMLDGEIGAWPRTPLDEAGRAAHAVHQMLVAAWTEPG